MINSDQFFEDISQMRAVWVDSPDTDVADLAKMADVAIGALVPIISVPTCATEKIWPLVENSCVQIFNRFDFVVDGNVADAVSRLASDVTSAFRNGAAAAQIFVPHKNIQDFVEMILPIRNDLFFNHGFCVGLNLDEMQDADWSELFEQISKISPDTMLITASGDDFDAKSDFVGRVYDMLMHWNLNVNLHIMFGKNMFRVCQTVRLVRNIRPNLIDDMRVFVAPEFIAKE